MMKVVGMGVMNNNSNREIFIWVGMRPRRNRIWFPGSSHIQVACMVSARQTARHGLLAIDQSNVVHMETRC